MELNGGINTYAYVGGNPLSYADPNGLSIEDANYIFGQMQGAFRDVQPNGYVYLGSLPDRISGQTTKLTGNSRACKTPGTRM
ncbi:MAG: hypothetical protein EKK52_18770 [Burkholderiales bacterium]|nr:MAG: hypothetical protein EKK52_18770 [Burkholderiales bacterium]